MADFEITLEFNGPVPDELPARQDKTIKIINATGYHITVTADKGLFLDMLRNRIDIRDGESWEGRLGRKSGEYWYWIPDESEGTEEALGVRTGRINV